MTGFLSEVWQYFAYIWEGLTRALTLDPTVFQVVESNPNAVWVVLGIVFLAGVSTLLGHSAILFINRVRKSRFVVSLIVNGIVYIISYAVWGFVVWLVGRLLFQVDPPLGQFLRIVGLSTAPLVFGFFILIPWMGPFIGKVLNVWSFLILLAIVAFQFQIGFWGSLLTVGLGWLASLVLNNTIGKPVVALRNRLAKIVTGSSLDVKSEDILLHFAGADLVQNGAQPTAEGGSK
jgi:hypothetical protein